MNGTNSSAKHYDMVVIGSGPAGHHGAFSRQTRQKDCGGRTLYSLIEQIAPSTLKPVILRHPLSNEFCFPEAPLFSEQICTTIVRWAGLCRPFSTFFLL
jgi:hypothetical protein